jgi:hypothetical protein
MMINHSVGWSYNLAEECVVLQSYGLILHTEDA